MKFNIEVEIDWLGENGELDSVIKEEITSGVVERLSEDAIKKITNDAMNRVNEKLDELVTKLFNGFMNKGVTLTDRWGEVVEENVKIEDLMKRRLENSLFEKVNDSGNKSEYGNTTRINYMVNSRVDKAVKIMTEKVIKEVDSKIEQKINEEIKSKLSNSLLAKIDVDNIIQNVVKGFK